MELPITPPPIMTISQYCEIIGGSFIHGTESSLISSFFQDAREFFIDSKPFFNLFGIIKLESFFFCTILLEMFYKVTEINIIYL